MTTPLPRGARVADVIVIDNGGAHVHGAVFDHDQDNVKVNVKVNVDVNGPCS